MNTLPAVVTSATTLRTAPKAGGKGPAAGAGDLKRPFGEQPPPRTIALVQERVNSSLGGLASRRDEVKQRCRTVLQSKAGGLLRNSQPNSPRPVIAHATCNLTNQCRSGRLRFALTATARALRGIQPDGADPAAPVFGLTGEALANRVRAAAPRTAASVSRNSGLAIDVVVAPGAGRG